MDTADKNLVPLTVPASALEEMSADAMLYHIELLSSDAFEGRAPGSEGETLSVEYITRQFRQFGLGPGNPDGSYVQDVPLAGLTATPAMAFNVAGSSMRLNYPADFVASTARLVPKIAVENSDVVFVGYGVVAPEYGWDDYKDVDVRGKTLLMLISDPAIPDSLDPSKLDESMFKGRAMTYYGRWTYKYEIAALKGAAAAIIIHETGPAAYPYSVVETSWAREIFEIDASDKNESELAVRSWISEECARALLNRCGQSFDELKRASIRKDFRPVSVGATLSVTIKNSVRQFSSRNVIAKISGCDPVCGDELIIYCAHWDHLGRSESEDCETKIFRGAIDNASGVAMLLELARAYAALKDPPKRTILFLSTTAEEAGLLGAQYYASHPLYPLQKTLAVINIDTVNPWGKTRDVENICAGHSSLDKLLAKAADLQNRIVLPDPQPEKGMLYRADHFEFAKEGVPCLYPSGGKDVIGQPPEYGRQKSDEFVAKHYHQPSDRINPDWDLSGALEDARLLFTVGYQISNGDFIPNWNPDSEFKREP